MKLLRPMRMLVFFDLPVVKKKERKRYAQFRTFLLKDGYDMLQYSVYSRFCNGLDAVSKHQQRLEYAAPDKGAVRLMVVTDKQYGEMQIVVGDKTGNEKAIGHEQLCIF